MGKGTILYVGGFILPDKNAAAQRVVGIAKALRTIGYNVVFINKSPDGKNYSEWEEKDYFGFKCYEIKNDHSKRDIISSLYDISFIKKFINIERPEFIIAYNYPAIALDRLNRYCKKAGIKCIGDDTEWYRNSDSQFLYRLIKVSDTEYRMRIVNRRLSGNIVISDYLEQYYRDTDNIVNIPPLVDKSELKWNVTAKEHNDIRFIYAGSPSKEKERLDIIYGAVDQLSEKHDVRLFVLGITDEQFIQMYGLEDKAGELNSNVIFLGRVPHESVINEVANADYSIIIRDNNLVNTAGFPTKFVESISCGTPIIANDSSCIKKYIKDGYNGLLVDEKHLYRDLVNILNNKEKPSVDPSLFDFNQYVEKLDSFMSKL